MKQRPRIYYTEGQRALSRQFSGVTMVMGRAIPSLVGMSSSSSERSTNSAAARVTAMGQFTLPRTRGDVPVKSR